MGEPAHGRLALRERRREVEVDARQLAGGEEAAHVVLGVEDEDGVVHALLDGALRGEHHADFLHVHAHEEHVGLGLGALDGEASLAAAQVKAHLAGAGQQHLGPVAGTLLGIVDDGVGKETPAFVEVLGFACAHGLAFRWVSRRCGRIPRPSRAPVL